MKSISKILCFLILMVSIQILSAQKFSYVKTEEILQTLPEVKQANSELETYRNQLISLGQKRVETLRSKYTDLQQKQAQGNISPVQLEQETNSLKEEEQQIVTFEQESQQKIMTKSEELLGPVRDKVQKAIDDVAKELNYTYVFDNSTGFILYADETADITPQVKAKLGL
jgi:outer membrane protein